MRVSPLYLRNQFGDSSQVKLVVTGGGMEMSDPEFVCAACDKGHESHAGDVMTECRVCKRLHCGECVDEYGNCIECSKDK
jgi:hypothetical protein